MSRTKEQNAKVQYRWYLKNKIKQQEKVKHNRSRLRQFVIDSKKGLSCVECGFSDYRALQWHHLDPSKKEFSLSHGIRSGVKKETLQDEIDKCVLLCANCHSIFHHSDPLPKNP